MFESNVHTDFFIESGCSCQVLRIDTQPNFVDATTIKFSEGVKQEGVAKSFTTPGTPYRQLPYPTEVHVLLVLTQNGARELVSVEGQEPESGIEAVPLHVPVLKLLVCRGLIPPVILEGFFRHFVNGPLFLANDEIVDSDASRPCRHRRCPIQDLLHAPEFSH